MHGKTINYEKKSNVFQPKKKKEKKNPIMNEEFKLLLKKKIIIIIIKKKKKQWMKSLSYHLCKFFFCAFQLDLRQ